MATRPLNDLAACLSRFDPAASGVPDAELLRRFADARDEAAFELLVWRHGGLVLGTCRRVLGRSADADDAFQATFLALARKAGAVRRGESLPGWLHRVALRAALRLRASATRNESLPLSEVAAPSEPLPDDTASVLDEEIGRLPHKLRIAFVLCELEGRTDAEAAELLGCPKGTVLSRLSRARERLRVSLTRRGLAVAAAGVVVGAPEAITAALAVQSARASVSFAASRTAEVASPRAASLASGVLRAMTLDALKPVAVLAVAVVVMVAVGVAFEARARDEQNPPVPPPAPAPQFVAAPVPAPAPPAPPPNFKLPVAEKGMPKVEEVRFSPNGKWLVTAGSKPNGDTVDPIVLIWDAGTGKYLHTLNKPDAGAAMDFSSDSKLFATANLGDNTVSLWATGTWKELATLEHPMATDIGFSPDGKLLVSHSCAFSREVFSEVKVWNADGGKLVFARKPKKNEALTSVVFSPDGKALAVSSSLGVVQLLDAKTGKARTEIKTPTKPMTVAAFSPGSDKLLTWTPDADAKAPVRVWDAATGKEEMKLEGSEPTRFAGFSPNGKHIAVIRNVSLEKGPSVSLWDAATGKKTASLSLSKENPSEAHWLSFSPDGSLLVVCGSEQQPNGNKLVVDAVSMVFSMPDGKELLRLPGVRSVVLNQDGTTAAVVKGPALTGGLGPRKVPDDEVIVLGVAELLKKK